MPRDTIQISATVATELHRRLAIAAATENRTRSELISEALADWLTKHKY